MSNEVVETPEPATEPPKPALMLIGGEDDLVCVDDTCLPADVVAELGTDEPR